MNEKELKLTDLDYAIGDHHLQMLKAALPYMEISQQKALSLFVKWNELVRTMEFFEENDEGMLSVCSLEAGHASAVDMLAAVKPYANPREQELIDVFSNILISRRNRPQGRPGAAFSIAIRCYWSCSSSPQPQPPEAQCSHRQLSQGIPLFL